MPTLGDIQLTALTTAQVRTWWIGLDHYPTRNGNAYGLLKTILNQAVDEEVLQLNPCRIRGATIKHRVVEPRVLTPEDTRRVIAELPRQWRPLIALAAVSGLRWGELAALRRMDLCTRTGRMTVTVNRGVTKDKGKWVVGRPKSTTALRTIPLPEGLRPLLEEQLDHRAEPGNNGLVFPAPNGGFMDATAPRRALNKATASLGYDKMRLHDLRHSAATMFAQAGATLADHMMLMGHTSSAMSARYTHTNAERTRAIIADGWGA